jgi:hypothetical protein
VHRWRKKSPVRRTPADAVRRAILRQALEVTWLADRPAYTQGMTHGAVQLMTATAGHPYRLDGRGTVMRRSSTAKRFSRSERTITRWRAEARKAGRARLVAPPRSQDARGRWRNHGCYGTVLTPPQAASDYAVAVLGGEEPLPDDLDLFDPELDLDEEDAEAPEAVPPVGQTPRSHREDVRVPGFSLRRAGDGDKIAASPGSSVSGPPDEDQPPDYRAIGQRWAPIAREGLAEARSRRRR